MLLKIKKEDPTLFILVLFFYIAAPVIECWTTYNEYLRGDYPPQSDSLGLGFAGIFISWILLAPFVFGFIIWALWKCPAQINVFGVNEKRPFWSFIWSVTFGLTAFAFIFTALTDFYQGYFIEAFREIAIGILLAIFRGIVVFRK